MIVRTVLIGGLALVMGVAIFEKHHPDLPATLHAAPAKRGRPARRPPLAARSQRRPEPVPAQRSFNARSEDYCRERLGDSTSLMMGFSGGRSARDLKLLYVKLLREEPETAEAENQRQQTLVRVEQLITNYEIGVQECKWGLLNGVSKLPDDFR